MWGAQSGVPKTEMFRIQLNIDVHTLRTPPTANWLKGGVWATKTCTKKHLLRSSYRSRPVSIKKEKVTVCPKPQKSWRGPWEKTSTYAQLPTYVAYAEARVAPGVLRPVHCPARRPRPPMALRHSIGRTYRHGLRAGFRAASAGGDPW